MLIYAFFKVNLILAVLYFARKLQVVFDTCNVCNDLILSKFSFLGWQESTGCKLLYHMRDLDTSKAARAMRHADPSRETKHVKHK